MGPYIPHTNQDEGKMLRRLGLKETEELFGDIPSKVRLKRKIDIKKGVSEIEVRRAMGELGSKNRNCSDYPVFLGAGAYDHYIPTTVGHATSRSEFYTAYTPYQPEISQGTLQAIYEYQSMMCALTGMEVSNASLYDGASAVVEAAFMALNTTRRKKILVSGTMNPEYRKVLNTSMNYYGAEVVSVPYDNGVTNLEILSKLVDDSTAAVILQSPNFFGMIEDIPMMEPIIHKHKALFVLAVDPISLGLLTAPGELGVDILVGEGQALGNPLSFGGPYLGFIACTRSLIRKMPGRIVGETMDLDGKRGFVSTLQTREQHIRREKATSNICSNQALNALAACVYLATLGKQGIVDVAKQCYHKSHYALNAITKTRRFRPAFTGPFFKEFTVIGDVESKKVQAELLKEKIIGGYELEREYPEFKNAMLYCVTEKRTKVEIERLAKVLEGIR